MATARNPAKPNTDPNPVSDAPAAEWDGIWTPCYKGPIPLEYLQHLETAQPPQLVGPLSKILKRFAKDRYHTEVSLLVGHPCSNIKDEICSIPSGVHPACFLVDGLEKDGMIPPGYDVLKREFERERLMSFLEEE
ncbi:hypothetical protein BJ508DRAFT_328440 [Ascobolus immersus RN42]|uniref:Uncharacterized protein n=1 Tax=Ascobolus immersus RN42 TaxID=1160509 RepID=A0A3N4I1U7_ASCIM|nr:hypothetical protein BJ508DRAFT_328440 [Ascobolus immersus RN42]